ncbi:MAG: hypothetical protein Q4A52_03620 [Bacillota bacterium]|nr:hypothetical protein [Bacillota bacterium]
MMQSLRNKQSENEELIREMPRILQELILTIRSGATLEEAMRRCLPERLRVEGMGAFDSLSLYAQKVNKKAVWRFFRLISQYRANGSLSSMDAMEKYHDELWQLRLVEIRKKAEEVSLKLTLLLMLSLISVIAVIMTPVVLLFQ